MARRKLYLLQILIFVNVISFSQTNTGTTIGQFLLIEPSARLAGMGNIGVASFEDVSSIYFNPASAGMISSSSAVFSHINWLADIKYEWALVAVRMRKFGTIFLGFAYLNSGEIDVRTVEKPLGTGERYYVTNMAIGLGYSLKLTDRFALGLQANYIQETIWHSSLWAVGVNFGIIYQIVNDLFLGASISNFGTRGRYDGWDLRVRYDADPRKYGDNSNLPAQLYTEKFPLPVLFRVGFSYKFSLSSKVIARTLFEAHHPSDNTESVSFGGEMGFFDVFFARVGYQKLFQKDSEVGLTFGFGLHYPLAGYVFNFDYGWADHGRLGSTQRFSIGVEF